MHLEDVDPREFVGTDHRFLCRKDHEFFVSKVYSFAGICYVTDNHGVESGIGYFDEVKMIVYKVD